MFTSFRKKNAAYLRYHEVKQVTVNGVVIYEVSHLRHKYTNGHTDTTVQKLTPLEYTQIVKLWWDAQPSEVRRYKEKT